ncbi:putative carboxylesterase 2 [Acorus calamus]|uniref:Carboxylesterase 2 n=1 Tax=Acorus calamus TaxID=4465 RepID=A0AAV9FG95_ACOCL|nr:putative carboxylesterase 2 [Acorus calamus]
MVSTHQEKQVVEDLSPFFLLYSDGTISRFGEDLVSPPSLDPLTGVTSKDVIVSSDTGVIARLYLPKLSSPQTKLPLFIFFHGGAFCMWRPSSTAYHQYINSLTSQANVVAVSIDYRRPPEHPLPTAYDDSWDAVKWALSHAEGGGGPDAWLSDHVDFDKVYLAGDSAGANIAHNMAMRARGVGKDLKFEGVVVLHPYFWGTDVTEAEAEDPSLASVIGRIWKFVHPTSVGNDDPLINPVGPDAPSLSGIGCRRVLVCVAGKDLLRDRGRRYYEALIGSGWDGEVELWVSEGVGHCFFLMDGTSESSKDLMARVAGFLGR